MTTIPLTDLPFRYGFIDPAAGKRGAEFKKTRARSAIAVVAPDWLGRIFILKAWGKHCPTDRLIDEIYATEEQFGLKVLGCEANAMQSLFSDVVRRDARLANKRLPLVPITQPTRINKEWRIRTLVQPLMQAGKLFMREDMHDLAVEVGGFPLHPLKDIIDAVASAIALIPPRPVAPERDSGLDGYLDYLRKSGAPSWYVEQAARARQPGMDVAIDPATRYAQLDRLGSVPTQRR